MGRTGKEIEMMKQKTDQEINAWLDGLSAGQIRLWGAPEPRRATNLEELAAASGVPIARLMDEAMFIGETEESYAELILERIVDNPLYARHRELAEARLTKAVSA